MTSQQSPRVYDDSFNGVKNFKRANQSRDERNGTSGGNGVNNSGGPGYSQGPNSYGNGRNYSPRNDRWGNNGSRHHYQNQQQRPAINSAGRPQQNQWYGARQQHPLPATPPPHQQAHAAGHQVRPAPHAESQQQAQASNQHSRPAQQQLHAPSQQQAQASNQHSRPPPQPAQQQLHATSQQQAQASNQNSHPPPQPSQAPKSIPHQPQMSFELIQQQQQQQQKQQQSFGQQNHQRQQNSQQNRQHQQNSSQQPHHRRKSWTQRNNAQNSQNAQNANGGRTRKPIHPFYCQHKPPSIPDASQFNVDELRSFLNKRWIECLQEQNLSERKSKADDSKPSATKNSDSSSSSDSAPKIDFLALLIAKMEHAPRTMVASV